MFEVLVTYVVPVIHVIACVFLAVVVLLQTGKGADMGAVFGGGSQTLFGSGGAGNLLTKLTTATAVVFMVTSLLLSYGQSHQGGARLLDRIPTDAAAPAATPPAPAANAAQTNQLPAPQAAAPEPAPAAPADAPADGQ